MITLKTHMYKQDDKQALHETMGLAINLFFKKYCDWNVLCSQCKYRHVCADLISAAEYAKKLNEEK